MPGIGEVPGQRWSFGNALRSALTGGRSTGRLRNWLRAAVFRPPPLAPPDLLSQAQKMEALGRLTGGVAHDFNNLLTVVLGNAAALRVQAESRDDAQGVRRAEMIERAAERGGRLASQLLAFSRKQMLRPEIVSVYRVISAMLALLAQAVGESVRVQLHAEPRLWNCLVDPGQLESAILNLVLNARDAMPVGGNISISCHNITVRRSLTGAAAHTPGDYVRIDVSDPGCGIPAALTEKVFEPFFTTKPVGQGSGLGLAQVHGFAGQTGGWVTLDSEVGKGTTVSLFLPRAEGRDVEPSPANEGSAPVGRNETILVVEPDTDLRMTTCGTLTRSGYRPIWAANASGALAHLVSDQRIHGLLTEVDLPGGVSGLALARSARQTRPDLSVVVTTGRTLEGAAADDFDVVMKPYPPLDLVKVMSAALSGMTFSVETERWFAESRHIQPSRVVQPNLGGGVVPVGGGLRRNAIRLGVSPFRAIGAADTSFSVGLAEEITTAFSRFRWITCVAPASVAVLSEQADREAQRWRDLDLDFLVEGSFRRKGHDIRVVLRLIDMRTSGGELSWGRRFDSAFTDLLNLQDRIAAETAAQVAPELLVWKGQEATSRPQIDPTAYDLMLRAIPAIYRLDQAGFREAGALLEKSLLLDPTSAACHSWLAHWYLFSLGQGWEQDVPMATRRAADLSKRAVLLDPGDARGFTVAGHVRAFLNKDAEAALALHERAISLNPNLALAWCYSGLAHCYLGQHQEAIRRIEHAQRLSPHDPHGFFYDMALGMPLLLTGQYEAAAAVGRRARDRNPGLSSSYKGLLAALGHLGADREAASVWRVLSTLEPGFSLAAARLRSPIVRPEDTQRYVEGLRLAGVPPRSMRALVPHR